MMQAAVQLVDVAVERADTLDFTPLEAVAHKLLGYDCFDRWLLVFMF